MQKNKIVVITHRNENQCIDDVAQYLDQHGFELVRFNSDEFPYHNRLEIFNTTGVQQSALITPQGLRVTSDEIHALWYRRFYPGKGLPKEMEPQQRAVSVEESKRTMLGYFDSLSCFKMNDYWAIRRASNKELQLRVARDLGLTLPDTLTTNSPQAVREFYQRNQRHIITKMQTSFSLWQDSKEQVVFTNLVEEHHLDDLEALKFCPMVFQQAIDKEVELRATVVGDQVFCAAIDPTTMAGMDLDWRKRGQQTLEAWQPYTLPHAIQDQLVALAQKLGLSYGAADIIVTPEGKYVFLEINPCGEFYWMDKHQHLGISQAIAKRLIQG
ncbi:TPA: hypothetical protein RQK93_003329 [Vibrio vulnificus]|nr:hypothetical protein [Vibrio vulnificus]